MIKIKVISNQVIHFTLNVKDRELLRGNNEIQDISLFGTASETNKGLKCFNV